MRHTLCGLSRSLSQSRAGCFIANQSSTGELTQWFTKASAETYQPCVFPPRGAAGSPRVGPQMPQADSGSVCWWVQGTVGTVARGQVGVGGGGWRREETGPVVFGGVGKQSSTE